MPNFTHSADELPVAVIGAGPVGLAAAVHLLEQGLEPLVLEAGDDVGAAVSEWGHIKLFSPWQYNIDASSRRVLEPTGWQAPRLTALPTGAQFVEDYLQPLARSAALSERIRLSTRVTGISRGGRDKTHLGAREGRPFLLRTEQGGEVLDLHARAVIDASGTWSQPNPLGAAGLPALGEHDDAVAPHLISSLPDVLGTDRQQVAGKRVLVVGSGHSATNTLLNLVALKHDEPATEILWAIRGASPARSYGGGDRDGLRARGALGERLRQAVEAGQISLLPSAEIRALSAEGDTVGVSCADGRYVDVGAVVRATGFRPELGILRELRLDLDPGLEAPTRLAPLIDPEFHSCGTVPAHGAEVLGHPEEGFFIAGMKSYGRAPTFLLATGYEQVRSIAAYLAGHDATAKDLNLPATGVCSGVDPDVAESEAVLGGTSSSCCSSAPQPVTIGVPTGPAHGRQP